MAGVFLSVLQLGLIAYITLRVRADPSLTHKEASDHDGEEGEGLHDGHDHHHTPEEWEAHGHHLDGSHQPQKQSAPASIGAVVARRGGRAGSGSDTPYTPLAQQAH